MPDLEEAARRIDAYIEEHRTEMVEFLQGFLAVPSVTYGEKEAVDWLANRMLDMGYDEVRVDRVGNVCGRVGSGQTVLLYDAHIDTVETGDPAAWPHDPLGGELDGEGRIWGRGAVDDKGPLAAITWAARALLDLGYEDHVTMLVSGSISEEDVEGACAAEMLRIEPSLNPDYIIVSEPSEGDLKRGHKGRALIRITVPGRCAHASCAERGENALIKALPILQALGEKKEFPEDPFLGRGSIEVTKVECDTPSLNTIPGSVTIFCDRRIARGESREELLAELEPILALVPDATAAIDQETVTTYTGHTIQAEDYFPSWEVDADHPIVEAGRRAYRSVYGKEPVVDSWGFCTNATALCAQTGIPGLGFGPGEMGLCHSTEEHIRVQDYLDAAKFFALLALQAGAEG